MAWVWSGDKFVCSIDEGVSKMSCIISCASKLLSVIHRAPDALVLSMS